MHISWSEIEKVAEGLSVLASMPGRVVRAKTDIQNRLNATKTAGDNIRQMILDLEDGEETRGQQLREDLCRTRGCLAGLELALLDLSGQGL